MSGSGKKRGRGGYISLRRGWGRLGRKGEKITLQRREKKKSLLSCQERKADTVGE